MNIIRNLNLFPPTNTKYEVIRYTGKLEKTENHRIHTPKGNEHSILILTNVYKNKPMESL
jgi:hypothetical protein